MSGARREDGRILRGQTRYLDDIIVPGIAEVAFVRSPHAHASIEAIEVPAGVTGGDRRRPRRTRAAVPAPGAATAPSWRPRPTPCSPPARSATSGSRSRS